VESLVKFKKLNIMKKKGLNMDFWNRLEDTQQTIIKIFLMFFFILLSVFFWYRANKIQNDELNAPLVVQRSAIKEMKLLKSSMTKEGVKVSLIEMATSKRYDDILVSKNCPNYKDLSGKKMYLTVIKKIRPLTGEESFEFDRLYNYICTKKNMEEEDLNMIKDYLDNQNKK
jgi:hypothetical protein